MFVRTEFPNELGHKVERVEVTKYKHPDPSVLKRGPVGMQIHAAVGIFDHKAIRNEAEATDDRLITVK